MYNSYSINTTNSNDKYYYSLQLRRYMQIKEASHKDISAMNDIVIAAKRHWGYSDEQMDLWLSGLLIDKTTFNDRKFWVLEHQQQIIGVASVSCHSKNSNEYELEDCWILPKFMGIGAGKFLFDSIVGWLKQNNAKTLWIVADPNAEGFYRRMGAEFIRMKPSVPKDRMIPVFKYVI